MRRELKKMGEFQRQRVWIGLFAEIEKEFSVGALVIGGGHEVGD